MTRYFALIFASFFLVFGACGDGDGDPYNPNDPNFPGSSKLPEETKLPELDGIPSSFTMERHLFYVSSQESAPGLYAYNPLNKSTTLVAPDLDLERVPFAHMLPLGKISANETISEYRAGGVMYATLEIEDMEGFELPHHQYNYIAGDGPDALTPHKVSSTLVTPGSGLTGLFSYDLADLRDSSFLQTMGENTRFDMGMDSGTPAIDAPEGKPLWSTLSDDLHTHAYWLYIDENDDLVVYDRDFSNKTTVVDSATGDPIGGLNAFLSQPITAIGYDSSLFGLAFDDDSDDDDRPNGVAYVVTMPSDANPTPTAKKVVNKAGEPLLFPSGLLGGLMIPGDNLLYSRDGVIVYGGGSDLFGMLLPGGVTKGVNLTRIENGEWSNLNITSGDLEDFVIGGINLSDILMLPPMLIPVSGHGAFWAPGGAPELIEPTDKDPSTWKRTSLADILPEPEDTPTAESVNGWIYYNHARAGGGAIAYHVPSKKVVHLPKARWVGASTDGTSKSIGAVDRLNISDVFLITKNKELAAVPAESPDQGIVILGKLPDTFDELAFRGMGTGPHRLVNIKHKDNSYEVVAVDTQTKNSLHHVMDAPAKNWEKVIGKIMDTEMTTTIRADHTRPIDLY